MSKKKGLPEIIFVVRNGGRRFKEANGEDWLQLEDSIMELAEIGKTITVGKYRLVKMHKVKGTVEFVD